MAHGQIVWSELATRDVEAAKAHFAAVAGWTFKEMPMAGGDYTYTIASVDGRDVAGLMDVALVGNAGVPPHWLTYIAVDDLAAAVRNVEATGGSIVRPPFEVPTIGRIAVVREPSGAVCGLLEPETLPQWSA